MGEITLLDGGMGQELVHRADDKPTPLWSTQVMLDHPGLVAQVHGDYFAAGATVASTNTYAIHRDRLVKAGLEDRFADLHAAALSEAKTARDAFGAGRIAGCIGPLGASYRPDIHPPYAESVPLYAEIADHLIAAGADILLLETVASLAHARAALDAAKDKGKPVWLAVTVSDSDGTHLRSGEAVDDVIEIAHTGAAAILANCSAPEAMPAALAILAKAGLPFGAYANGFAQITEDFLKDSPTVESLSPRRDLTPQAYAQHVMRWVDQGATIVGGCCETGPAHIAAIAAALRSGGHTIV